MRKSRLLSTLCLITLVAFGALGSSSEKKPSPGPLSGTWECMSHGRPQGDMAFTLYLEQDKEIVTGSVSSPIGGDEITSGSFKRKLLELQIDTQQGKYVIMGKLEKGQFTGTWTLDNGEKGTWEGKKVSANK
ncbi:MAG: hypothetical protein HY508_14715 [Acidobacteria bacterium]|nr:hypothetical protein [Acidobacteriota bacterium]